MATLDTTGSPEERVWFLADAHLEPASSPPGGAAGAAGGARGETSARTRDLLALLALLPERASHCYLVGDIFDFWFEYRRGPTEGHAAVLDALRQTAESGVSIHFLGGNHDYWAGRELERMAGVRVHRTPVDTTHCGRRLFIAHGDGLPEGDVGYKMLQALIRSDPAIACFRLLPPSLGASIGRRASDLSEITEERIERAIPAMRDFLFSKVRGPYDAAVVGHVHRAAHWSTPDGDALIVGDWLDSRSALLLDAGGFRHFRWQDDRLVPVESPTGS